LQHLSQLTELGTGQNARLGLPKEHLSTTKVADIDSPIYATGIGLLIRAFKQLDEEALTTEHKNILETPKKEEIKVEEPIAEVTPVENTTVDISEQLVEEPVMEREEEYMSQKPLGRKSLMSSWTSKFNQWIKSDIEDFDSK